MRPADAFRILEIFYLFEMAWKKKKRTFVKSGWACATTPGMGKSFGIFILYSTDKKKKFFSTGNSTCNLNQATIKIMERPFDVGFIIKLLYCFMIVRY